MGYLDGFLVTLRQHRLFGGNRVTTSYSGGRVAKKGRRRPRRQRREDRPSPSGCTVATSSTATRTAWRSASAASCAPACARPSASTCAAPTTTRRPDVAGRALRLRLRDQLPALHPLRPVRRGLPDRGDHRDRSCSSSRFTNRQRRDLHQGRAGRRRRRQAAAAAVGGLARRRRRSTPAAGCGPPSPSGDADFDGEVGWSGELGYGVRAPEPAADASATPSSDAAGCRARRAARASLMELVRLRHRARRWCSAARSASSCVPQPGARRAQPRAHAVRRRRAVHRPGRPLPRRRAGDRLRRRDRRAVPVRDHAARRRPRRGPARRAAQGPAPAGRRSSALGLARPADRGDRRRPRRPVRCTGATASPPPPPATTTPTSSSSPTTCSPTTSSPSSSPRCCWSIAVVGTVLLARRPTRPPWPTTRSEDVVR